MAAAAAAEPLVPSLLGEQLQPPPPPSARGPRPERARRAARAGEGGGGEGGGRRGREGVGGGSRSPGDQSPRGRPWRRRRRQRLTLGASCRAPGRHVRGWRGRAGRRRGRSRGRGRARGAAPAAFRPAARAAAGLPVRRRRRRFGRLRTGDGSGGGGHGRRTRRRRLGPDRREEGATALGSAGQETGETRSVLRLQGTRSPLPGRPGGLGPCPRDPRPLPRSPLPRLSPPACGRCTAEVLLSPAPN